MTNLYISTIALNNYKLDEVIYLAKKNHWSIEFSSGIEYFDEIEQLGILECNLSAIHPDVITELAKKGRYYTSTQLRDISSKLKQEAIIICFLQETAKTILDYIVNVFKRILLDTNRRVS